MPCKIDLFLFLRYDTITFFEEGGIYFIE